MPTGLAEIQRRVWRLLTAPEGVRSALAEAGDPAGASLEAWLRSDARLDAVARLEIYANAYFHRIHDALAEDFAALASALGSAGFHDLVTAYLLAHPPRHFSLRHAGDRLAEFLAADPAAEPFRRRSPFAPDLARLESALADAFDAADAELLGREELAALPRDRWEELAFAFHPSLRLVRAGFRVELLREATGRAAPTSPAPVPPAEPVAIQVWRRDETVRFRALDPLDADLLEAARAGVRFGALCERLAEALGAAEAPARAVSQVETWLAEGLLVRSLPERATGW